MKSAGLTFSKSPIYLIVGATWRNWWEVFEIEWKEESNVGKTKLPKGI
jgi:hypothetical protein